MFNTVKAKLTFLFTGSLLFILAVFIVVLYWFISGAIKNQAIEDLKQFYESEHHDILEDFYEDDDDFLEHKGEEDTFYYLFDSDGNLLTGKETVRGFSEYLEEENIQIQSSGNEEVKWENSHFLLMSFPLKNQGSLVVGKNITNEKHLIQNIIWILLLLALFFSLLFAWMGNFFAGQAMKPIQRSFNTQRKFVSDASHELRTPLSIFYSSIDVLAREEKQNLSPFGKEIIEDVKRETEMMNKLLSDLLFLARNDQDHFELDLEECNLSLLMQSLLKRFSRIVPSHLTFSTDIQEDVCVKGDKVRIEQLVYILLDNAIRYTQEGTIACSLKADDKKIELRVRDTGSGISPGDLPHVFDRFYRGDEARHRNGSGLGLSIAKTIVDAHGGRIRAESTIGKGTEFIITFNNH